MPQISIIVPVYKVEKYIRRCLDSIIAQTFTDWECLLIDDGSPDNSGKICDEYAEKDYRFRVFHKENGGVASARQLGLDNSIGDYIIHCDPDDWVDRFLLSEMFDKIVVSRSDIVVCDFFIETNQGSSLFINKFDSISSESFFKGVLINDYFGGLWNKLIRHSIFKEHSIRFIEGINYCEDVLLLAQLCSLNLSIVYLGIPLYHYNRCNLNSISINYSETTFLMRQKFVNSLDMVVPNKVFKSEKKYAEYLVHKEACLHGYYPLFKLVTRFFTSCLFKFRLCCKELKFLIVNIFSFK